MKTKEFNHVLTCICEICEEPFHVGEEFIIHTITLTTRTLITFDNIFMPLAQEDLTKVAEHQKFLHYKCLLNPKDALKESLNNLSKAQKDEMYKYLHNTWGCRL